jgi:hypothetical protein
MSRSTALVALAIVATGACAGDDRAPTAGKKDWPLSRVRTTPAEITVLGGTTFRCAGVPCQLLGVKESADPAIRAQAGQFPRTWFKSVGNYITIYNDSNPLVAEEGTAVVWVCGFDTTRSCLSEELVRAGLVEIDDARWVDYTFTVPRKAADTVEDWRGILRKAKQGHERGEKPRVLFDWPPK